MTLHFVTPTYESRYLESKYSVANVQVRDSFVCLHFVRLFALFDWSFPRWRWNAFNQLVHSRFEESVYFVQRRYCACVPQCEKLLNNRFRHRRQPSSFVLLVATLAWLRLSQLESWTSRWRSLFRQRHLKHRSTVCEEKTHRWSFMVPCGTKRTHVRWRKPRNRASRWCTRSTIRSVKHACSCGPCYSLKFFSLLP